MVRMPSPAQLAKTRGAWIAHTLGARALGEVIARCESAGIDVLPVKGIVTGRILYADVGERPIGDVDVKIRPSHVRRLADVARRAGWRLRVEERAYGSAVYEVSGRHVEFESHIGPPGLCRLSVVDMLAQSEVCVSPFGFRHRQPELHDHALLLVVNAFKDKITHALPPALRDLSRIAIHQDFRALRFVERARGAGITSLSWIVADWLARERGDEAWRAIRNQLGVAPPRPLYEKLFRRACSPGRPLSATGQLLARVGADRPLDRLRALAHLVGRGAEMAFGAAARRAGG